MIATQLGNAWIAVGVIGFLFVIRKNPQLTVKVFRSSIITYIAVELMKLIIGRPRPMFLLTNVVPREMAVFGYGFPSGHTAIATVLSLTLLPYIPKKFRWLCIFWIVVVAWSRIYLGIHAPLDVVGGFIIGLLVVMINDMVAKDLKRKR